MSTEKLHSINSLDQSQPCSNYEVAERYYKQEDYEKALEYFEKAYNEKKQQGLSDKGTADCLFRLGTIYGENFLDYSRAIKMLSCAEAIYVKLSDADAGNVCNSLGWMFRQEGEYKLALKWYKKALIIREKFFGKEHPDVATTCQNIAAVYVEQRSLSKPPSPKALEWRLKALAIREKVLGKEHPATAEVYDDIALEYVWLDNYTQALEWYQKALSIRENVLGKEHLDTMSTYFGIATMYDSEGKYSLAVEWYQKVSVVYEKVYGEHPCTAMAYADVAEAYDKDGNCIKAIEWYHKALLIEEKVEGKESFDAADVCGNIASVYMKMKEYDKSLEWYQKTLAIILTHEDEESLVVAEIYEKFAELYACQGDYAKALSEFLKVYRILLCEFKKTHHRPKAVKVNMEAVYQKVDNPKPFAKWLSEALRER